MNACEIELVTAKNEINSDFRKIGINKKVFEKAIEMGVRAYKSENEFSAPSAAGYNAWNSVLKTLRLELKTSKWGSNFDSNGVQGVINPLKKIVIIVNSGNENTGIANKNPRPKNQKGTGYTEIIQGNLDLFDSAQDLLGNNSIISNPIDPNRTYFFLYYIDEKNKEVRYELSLATNISNRNIGEWKQRIIFEPFDISHKPKVQLQPNQNNETEANEVDFDIIRKNG